MRTLIALAPFLALLTFGSAQACPNLSESEAVESAKTHEAQAAHLVRELFEESELVFIGRVLAVDEDAVPLSRLEPPDEHGMTPVGDMVFGQATVTPLRVLKGTPAASLELKFSRDESRIERSCGGVTYFRTVFLQPSYRYLLYVRDGEVLRANEVVDWFELLDTDTELRLLGNES